MLLFQPITPQSKRGTPTTPLFLPRTWNYRWPSPRKSSWYQNYLQFYQMQKIKYAQICRGRTLKSWKKQKIPRRVKRKKKNRIGISQSIKITITSCLIKRFSWIPILNYYNVANSQFNLYFLYFTIYLSMNYPYRNRAIHLALKITDIFL